MRQKNIGILMFFMIFLMNGCSDYAEPKGRNLASVIIAEYPKLSGSTGIDTELIIDGKSIYPERVASISPGKHEFSMEITAFYNGRAKHADIQKFFLDVLPNHRYIVKIKTNKHNLLKYDDVTAKYIVMDNDNVIYINKFILKDSILLSKPSNGVNYMVMNSIMYSAGL